MQRMSPSPMPPRRQAGYNPENQAQPREDSPALLMAGRIRAEQGPERAAQYLAAMEPFLAPGERSHIAYMLGLPQPACQPQPVAQPQQPFMPQQPQGGMGSMANIANIMQMMQLMNGLQGLKGGGEQPQGQNPLQLAQLLGGLMGGQKQ